jgi:hypothetical protein
LVRNGIPPLRQRTERTCRCTTRRRTRSPSSTREAMVTEDAPGQLGRTPAPVASAARDVAGVRPLPKSSIPDRTGCLRGKGFEKCVAEGSAARAPHRRLIAVLRDGPHRAPEPLAADPPVR